MEIYIHGPGHEDPELVEVEATAQVRDLLSHNDPDDDEQIWIGEAEDPVGLGVTLNAAGISHRDHLHRGRCRRIEVEVRFNSSTRERKFPPGVVIARVLAWATGPEGFDLPAEQGPKHVLAVPGADHFLAPDVHIGSLVAQSRCRVVLDLLPKVRFEG